MISGNGGAEINYFIIILVISRGDCDKQLRRLLVIQLRLVPPLCIYGFHGACNSCVDSSPRQTLGCIHTR